MNTTNSNQLLVSKIIFSIMTIYILVIQKVNAITKDDLFWLKNKISRANAKELNFEVDPNLFDEYLFAYSEEKMNENNNMNPSNISPSENDSDETKRNEDFSNKYQSENSEQISYKINTENKDDESINKDFSNRIFNNEDDSLIEIKHSPWKLSNDNPDNDTWNSKSNIIENNTKDISQPSINILNDEKSLNLVLDLDHTLIHSLPLHLVNSSKMKILNNLYPNRWHKIYFLMSNQPVPILQEHIIVVRDGVEEFLSNVYQVWNLFVNTKGTKEYALAILEILDPENKYGLKNRLQSKSDEIESPDKKLIK